MVHKLPVLNGRQVTAALERAGFTTVGGTKHTKMRGPAGQIVMVPNHPGEDAKPGTPRNILRQARLTADAFRAVRPTRTHPAASTEHVQIRAVQLSATIELHQIAITHEPSTDNERIVHDPRIMVGKPAVRGTRIPVERVIAHNPDLDDL